MGVEEEYFLVHPVARTVESAAARVVARAAPALGDAVSGEFTRCQVEVRTPPCAEMARLRAELAHLREGAAAAARDEGLRLCASGVPVLDDGGPADIGDSPRYRASADEYGLMMAGFTVCALQVHVHLPDRELAVLVGNHLRPWMPLLVAMTANSPFHSGRDTGYQSWRSVIRLGIPCSGPSPYAESMADYQRVVDAMCESGAMPVAGVPFWDIRPHPRLPTLEVRVMDVPAGAEDTVAVAALVRAMVATAAARVRAGGPCPRPGGELLRAAYWRAARDGWSGSGLDPMTGRVEPTPVQAGRLVERTRPALEEHGDTEVVLALLRRLAVGDSGARRQRASARRGGLPRVVDDLVERTEAAALDALPGAPG